jgi:hypothetical protein
LYDIWNIYQYLVKTKFDFSTLPKLFADVRLDRLKFTDDIKYIGEDGNALILFDDALSFGYLEEDWVRAKYMLHDIHEVSYSELKTNILELLDSDLFKEIEIQLMGSL